MACVDILFVALLMVGRWGPEPYKHLHFLGLLFHSVGGGRRGGRRVDPPEAMKEKIKDVDDFTLSVNYNTLIGRLNVWGGPDTLPA